jgi:hypothetical protein
VSSLSIPHELFALVIIVLAAVLLLVGRLTGAEWVDIVQWLGVAVVTGKAAQAVISSASSTKAPAAPLS